MPHLIFNCAFDSFIDAFLTIIDISLISLTSF